MRLSGARSHSGPHSSQWREGDPVTPENAATIPPGTAVATFEDGRYGNAASGNHAAIFHGPHYNADGLRTGIDVVDQSEFFQAQEHAVLFATTGRGYRADEFSVIRR
jgi:hypothetical protein